jgi:hypothetical protein
MVSLLQPSAFSNVLRSLGFLSSGLEDVVALVFGDKLAEMADGLP